MCLRLYDDSVFLSIFNCANVLLLVGVSGAVGQLHAQVCVQETAHGVCSEVAWKSDASVVLRLVGGVTLNVARKCVDTGSWCSLIVVEPYVEGASFVFTDCESDVFPSVVVIGDAVPSDEVVISVYGNAVVCELSVRIEQNLLA